MTRDPQTYRDAIVHPLKYRFYMLWRLPSLIFWGVKVARIDETASTVTLKHKWTNQNPFGSVYFSALNGAAELSTGILVQVLALFPLGGRELIGASPLECLDFALRCSSLLRGIAHPLGLDL